MHEPVHSLCPNDTVKLPTHNANMKHRLLFSVALVLNSVLLCSGAEVRGTVLNYGIFKKDMPEQVVRTPGTSSGVTRVGIGPREIITQTNRIPAKIGSCFGLTFEVSNLATTNGALIDIVKVVTHPPMTRPDGTVSKGFTFVEKAVVENGRATNWSGYGFDHPYELVPGLWLFEMRFEGKALVKQQFTVVRE